MASHASRRRQVPWPGPRCGRSGGRHLGSAGHNPQDVAGSQEWESLRGEAGLRPGETSARKWWKLPGGGGEYRRGPQERR